MRACYFSQACGRFVVFDWSRPKAAIISALRYFLLSNEVRRAQSTLTDTYVCVDTGHPTTNCERLSHFPVSFTLTTLRQRLADADAYSTNLKLHDLVKRSSIVSTIGHAVPVLMVLTANPRRARDGIGGGIHRRSYTSRSRFCYPKYCLGVREKSLLKTSCALSFGGRFFGR